MVLGLVIAVALFFGQDIWKAVFGFQFSVFSFR
jgi:hypothetical protein